MTTELTDFTSSKYNTTRSIDISTIINFGNYVVVTDTTGTAIHLSSAFATSSGLLETCMHHYPEYFI